MAKVTCPACEKESTMPETAIDLGGGWVDCSECGEIIFTMPAQPPAVHDELIREGRWEGEWVAVLPEDRK